MLNRLLLAINNQSISTLRNNIDFMSKEVAVELLYHAMRSSMTQYNISVFVAELLYWCVDDEIYAETNRSKYPKALQEALEMADNYITDSLRIKTKAVGQKVRRLKDLLKTESNPSKKDTTGNSALHYACDLGLNDVAKGFLVIGGDINLLNRQEDTPCHVTARLGRKVLLKDILLSQSMKERVNWQIQGSKLDDLIQAEWNSERWILEMFYHLQKPLAEGLVWCFNNYNPQFATNAIQLHHEGQMVWVHKNDTEKCYCCGKSFYAGTITGLACSTCNSDESQKILDEISGKKIFLREAKKTREGIVTHVDTYVENKVRGYHSRPYLNFFKSPSETVADRYFGFELELVLEDVHKMILASTCIDARAGSELYMNTDGSIRSHIENGERFNTGFELISHPMTLKYIKESQKLDDAFAVLQDMRARSLNNTSTGLHVHISRSGFKNNDNVESFHKFFYARHNAEFIAEMAGRERNTYQNNAQVTPPRGLYGGIRYEMINYNNGNTIEIRLFKGAVGKEWLLEKVEFLDCLIEFTQAEHGLTVSEFERFAREQGAYENDGKKKKFVYKYPQLVSFFETRKAKQKPIPFLYVA